MYASIYLFIYVYTVLERNSWRVIDLPGYEEYDRVLIPGYEVKSIAVIPFNDVTNYSTMLSL